MALLPYANQEAGAQQSQQAGGAGLLNDPMMAMILLSRLTGSRRRSGGGGSNALQMMMQMQQQEAQGKRQMQQDAIEQERLNMAKSQFGMQQQMYQQKLAEAQQEQAYNKQLAEQIMKGGQTGQEKLPPPLAANSPERQPPLNSANMVASNGAGVPQNTDIGERLQKTMVSPAQAQAVSDQQAMPQLLTMNQPDPQRSAMEDMQRRQMAAAYAQAGKHKEAMDLLKGPDTGEIGKKLAKKDADIIGLGREASRMAQTMLPEIQDFRDVLKETNDGVVGPLISKFGMNEMLSSNAQKLNQIGSNLTLNARKLLEMPAAGFSDADRDFLEKATLNTKFDKDTLFHIADKIDTLAKKSIIKNKFNEQYLKNNGSLEGADYDFFQKTAAMEQMAADAIKPKSEGGLGKSPQEVKAMLMKMRGY
jgi:hypothetical protein